MKKNWLLYFLIAGLGVLLFTAPRLFSAESWGTVPDVPTALSPASVVQSAPVRSAPVRSALKYETYTLPTSTVHVVRIPPEGGFQVKPAVASEVETVANFAQQQQAIAVINGGFFDPVNHKTTSYIVLQGEVVADPAENERLVTNPDMIPYLDRILNRSEFRQYRCGNTIQGNTIQGNTIQNIIQYDIAAHDELVPSGCELVYSLGAGPRLRPSLDLEAEAFAEVVQGEMVRDALGSSRPNARSAVGITPEGEVILVMAAQQANAPTESGVSLPELAEFLGTLGVNEAMNLDGGSSASLYYQGQTYFGKVDADGNPVERSVKSVLMVVEG
ncbi:MAG TPA: phosphodiester glycosidase family protein [Allocoleopsis sp.]